MEVEVWASSFYGRGLLHRSKLLALLKSQKRPCDPKKLHNFRSITDHQDATQSAVQIPSNIFLNSLSVYIYLNIKLFFIYILLVWLPFNLLWLCAQFSRASVVIISLISFIFYMCMISDHRSGIRKHLTNNLQLKWWNKWLLRTVVCQSFSFLRVIIAISFF